MRLAILIISIFATIAISLQSCAVGTVGMIAAPAGDHSGAQAAAVAIFYALGSAFAYGFLGLRRLCSSLPRFWRSERKISQICKIFGPGWRWVSAACPPGLG